MSFDMHDSRVDDHYGQCWPQVEDEEGMQKEPSQFGEYKNGHYPADCPKKLNTQTMWEERPNYIHGPCEPQVEDHQSVAGEKMSANEFEHLVSHKVGEHEDANYYDCPVCVFEVEQWRKEKMTAYSVGTSTMPTEGSSFYDHHLNKSFTFFGDKWIEDKFRTEPEDMVPEAPSRNVRTGGRGKGAIRNTEEGRNKK